MFAEFRQDITVILKNGGVYDINGLWIESDGAPFVTQASVQPATAREMETVPEGRYTSQIFRLYSDVRLHTVDKDAGINPDIVLLSLDVEDINRFEVIQVFPWQNRILSHYKMLIGKVDQEQ